MWHLLLLVITGLIYAGTANASTEEYPGRTIYPKVKIYDTEQLNASYESVQIVDVRSKFEFDTLHINSAINIPLNSPQFIEKVKALTANEKPIVFYCNGHRCFHSYKAVMKLQRRGVKNLYSYDSGIFDWSKAYPEKATLLGSTPVNTDLLISKSVLKKHMLEPREFVSKVNKKSEILDIREPVQRGLLELFPYRQNNISLSERDKLKKFISGFKGSEKVLMVYDEGGTQVRWLQYHLKKQGVKNYYFMAGGMKKYFKSALN